MREVWRIRVPFLFNCTDTHTPNPTTLESATPDHTRDDTRNAEHRDTGTQQQQQQQQRTTRKHWMDGWILLGANARYVMADVPRIEDGSGSAHSDEGDGSWRC